MHVPFSLMRWFSWIPCTGTCILHIVLHCCCCFVYPQGFRLRHERLLTIAPHVSMPIPFCDRTYVVARLKLLG